MCHGQDDDVNINATEKNNKGSIIHRRTAIH